MSRLWSALETIPGPAVERLEWKRLLEDEWPAAEPLLRRTGRVVEQVFCPSPGGQGCPRQVVHHPDGRIVAVCGERPKMCDPLALSADDIALLELDWRRLTAQLALILAVDGTTAARIAPGAHRLGEHPVAAGAGIGIVLWVPPVVDPSPSAALKSSLEGSGPTVLLTPTRGSLTTALLATVDGRGGAALALVEAVGADDAGALIGLRPAAELFAPVRDRLIRQRKIKAPEHRFPTPPGTAWEQVSIRFISGHDIHVQVRQEAGAYSFVQLGMANRKKKPAEPNLQWQLLVDFAEYRGELTWRNPAASPRKQKRKELLARALKTFFGLDEEPFATLPNGLGWRARFTVLPEA